MSPYYIHVYISTKLRENGQTFQDARGGRFLIKLEPTRDLLRLAPRWVVKQHTRRKEYKGEKELELFYVEFLSLSLFVGSRIFKTKRPSFDYFIGLENGDWKIPERNANLRVKKSGC